MKNFLLPNWRHPLKSFLFTLIGFIWGVVIYGTFARWSVDVGFACESTAGLLVMAFLAFKFEKSAMKDQDEYWELHDRLDKLTDQEIVEFYQRNNLSIGYSLRRDMHKWRLEALKKYQGDLFKDAN